MKIGASMQEIALFFDCLLPLGFIISSIVLTISDEGFKAQNEDKIY